MYVQYIFVHIFTFLPIWLLPFSHWNPFNDVEKFKPRKKTIFKNSAKLGGENPRNENIARQNLRKSLRRSYKLRSPVPPAL